MARYRNYKNGIFGHRYKGFYVIRNENKDKKKTYSIIDEKKNKIKENLNDYWDCEWEIDKITASPELIKILKSLYKEEIYMLSKFFMELLEKSNSEGLSVEEQNLYYWVQKVRQRKSNDKPY